MSVILDSQSENFKRTMLYGYWKKGLTPEVAVENLADDFPAITRQEVDAWFVRFRAGNLEIGECIGINAEGIVVDRSVRIKRELDDAEQADGEPPARMNPNPVIVPKREIDEVDGENQHPQGNAVANHVVAQQQPAPRVVPTVAFNQNPANPANRDPQVVPKIEGEDRDGGNPAQANRVNEVNRAPEIDRHQREARVRPVRRVQRAVAIPPQNPVHPVPIQPGMHPVNLANHFPLAPPPFPIAPQLLPNLPLNQLAIQFPLLFGPQQVMNPPYIGAALGLPMWNQAGNIGQLQNFNVGFGRQNWQLPQHQELAAQQNQMAVDNNHLDEDELPQHQEMAGQQNQVAVDNNHLEEDDSEEDDLEGDELPQLQELAAQQNQVAVNNNHLEEDDSEEDDLEEDDLAEDELPQHQELVAQRNRVAQNLRFRKIEICLGNGTVALCQCQTWEDELETLFVEKDEGCTIKRGPHQLESPDHFIDCAIDELKRVTANNGVEIKQLKVSCNQNVTSMNDIIKFFYGAAQAFEGETRHVEDFKLENATSKNEFDWSLVIHKSLMGIKIGPLVHLQLKTARLAGVRIAEVPALMQHLPSITYLSIISFWLPIAIVDVSHMTTVLMTVEELTLETVSDYRDKIVEQEKVDMHAFVGRYARNINESLRPFEDSRRGREDYDGMLPCFSPDHGIYFQIQRHGIVFTKLWK